MRMPYQRTGNGPNPKIAGIWNAMAPGDANMTNYDKPPEAVSPRNAAERKLVGAAGFEPARPFGQNLLRVPRLPLRHAPRGSNCNAHERMEAAAGFEPAHRGFAVRSLNH